jgi:cell division protein FtsB
MIRDVHQSEREQDQRPIPRRRQPPRFWSRAMLFAASVLLANGLFGERGLLDGVRAQRVSQSAARDLSRLRDENERLRTQIRQLRDDPATIEAIARRELGLVRPGEVMVTVRDLP